MRIYELLSQIDQSETKFVRPSANLLEAAEILSANNIGALPVIDATRKVVGILSERDLVRSIVVNRDQFLSKSVQDVMTSPVYTCSPDAFADEIYEQMNDHRVRHMPVVEDERLIAMLSLRDFENMYKDMRTRSLIDQVSGSFNLKHFKTMLDNEFNRYRRFESPLSIATFHIDRFDEIRKDKGQTAGDEVLKKLFNILESQTRAYDCIGRVSENQFAIIFPNTESRTAIRACERVIKTIGELPEVIDSESGPFTVSVGVTFANHGSRDGNAMLKCSSNLARMAAVNGGNAIEIDELEAHREVVNTVSSAQALRA